MEVKLAENGLLFDSLIGERTVKLIKGKATDYLLAKCLKLLICEGIKRNGEAS